MSELAYCQCGLMVCLWSDGLFDTLGQAGIPFGEGKMRKLPVGLPQPMNLNILAFFLNAKEEDLE